MIAITGATGNVGGKITEILLSRGLKIRCIARTADKLIPLTDQGAEAVAISLAQTEALTEAFRGAEAVFVMIPPNVTAPDFPAYQRMIGKSLSTAIAEAGVTHVVNLSSQGAHLSDRTGPIKGLHAQEERLNRLPGVNVLHLRPAYFMENMYSHIDMIKKMNLMGSAIAANVPLPMIATRDIAVHASERLAERDFSGIQVADLLGQRDLTMDEAARIIGRRIDKPDLTYVQFSAEDTQKALQDMGASADVAGLYVEMSQAFNDGLIHTTRTKENTTETSFEEFAQVFPQIGGRC